MQAGALKAYLRSLHRDPVDAPSSPLRRHLTSSRTRRSSALFFSFSSSSAHVASSTPCRRGGSHCPVAGLLMDHLTCCDKYRVHELQPVVRLVPISGFTQDYSMSSSDDPMTRRRRNHRTNTTAQRRYGTCPLSPRHCATVPLDSIGFCRFAASVASSPVTPRTSGSCR